LVKWVRILVGVGLHEVFSSGIISVSWLWKWSQMVGNSDTGLATFYVNENINTSLYLYLISDVQGKFRCFRFRHSHTNKMNSVPTLYLYDLSNECTSLFTMVTIFCI
jgi:hypothetical protein